MKKQNIIWYILVGMNLILLVLLGIEYSRQLKLQQGIAQKVLRFHVIANSDSDEDQALKLAVRDAVGAQMAEVLAGVKDRRECEQVIAAYMEEIKETASNVIAEQGYSYEVDAFVRQVDFPVKTYGTYTFPAGTYEALEVVIGQGSGKNWWCVMYPNMCFSGSVYEVVDEDAKTALKEVLSEEEYEKVFTQGDYEVQCKYLSFLNEFMQ